MYQNAKVMLEMADYASRNCEKIDRVLVETLRSDAMQIRVCVLMALAQYAFSQASEGVRVNAFRAASMYTGMARENDPVAAGECGGSGPRFRSRDVTRFLNVSDKGPGNLPGFPLAVTPESCCPETLKRGPKITQDLLRGTR